MHEHQVTLVGLWGASFGGLEIRYRYELGGMPPSQLRTFGRAAK